MLVNLNDVLPEAQKNHYAVGLFNATDSDMLEAVIAAAEEMRAPLIIGTAEIFLPYGELKLIAPSMRAAAERASVPVVMHYDHGLTFERCIEALQLGFTSVMFDGSVHPYDKNVALTAEMVRIAHAMGATVEGEIGHVGSNEDGALDASDPAGHTTVEQALQYQQATGVDALAIAVGTAHGSYKSKPKLNLTRLDEIRAAMDTPLVLHGGSGLADDDFKNAIARGIAKLNIHTDLCLAGVNAIREGLDAGDNYLDLRNRKVAAIKAEVEKKMKLFGCCNRY